MTYERGEEIPFDEIKAGDVIFIWGKTLPVKAISKNKEQVLVYDEKNHWYFTRMSSQRFYLAIPKGFDE